MLLETVTGKLIDPANPDPALIDIEDIAWGLSRISRFCGMTITPVPYTVAQHSIMVAKRVEQQMSVWGHDMCAANGVDNKTILKALLHDASEVYTGDVPSPTKRIPELYPIFKKIEQGLMDAVYAKYDLGKNGKFEEMMIHEADKWSQKIEAHAFMPSRGAHWEGMPSVTLIELQQFEEPMVALEAYKQFKEMFETLMEEAESE